jgi:hypothetical protein
VKLPIALLMLCRMRKCKDVVSVIHDSKRAKLKERRLTTFGTVDSADVPQQVV